MTMLWGCLLAMPAELVHTVWQAVAEHLQLGSFMGAPASCQLLLFLAALQVPSLKEIFATCLPAEQLRMLLGGPHTQVDRQMTA
jgi:hypothetical protein